MLSAQRSDDVLAGLVEPIGMLQENGLTVETIAFALSIVIGPDGIQSVDLDAEGETRVVCRGSVEAFIAGEVLDSSGRFYRGGDAQPATWGRYIVWRQMRGA